MKPLNRLCKPKQMCSRFNRAVAEKKHWSCCDLILLFWFGWEDEKGQHELKRTTSNDIYSYKDTLYFLGIQKSSIFRNINFHLDS